MTGFEINLKPHDVGYQLELDGRDLLTLTGKEMQELLRQYEELQC